MYKNYVFSGIVVATLLASPAYAVLGTHSAAIDVVSDIKINSIIDIQFGKVQRPTDVPKTIIRPADASSVPSGTATRVGDSTFPGLYIIEASDDSSFSVSVTDTGGEAGLTLSDFDLLYSGVDIGEVTAPNGGTLPYDESAVLLVGATLTIDPSVTAGNKTPTYAVEVNYQ